MAVGNELGLSDTSMVVIPAGLESPSVNIVTSDPATVKAGKPNATDSQSQDADVEALVAADDHVGGSGIPGTVANLVNTIVGSGVLALPSSAAKAGWALAVVFLVVSGVITWFGVYFLTEVARRLGGRDTSFGEAAAKTYPWMRLVVDVCVFAVSFGLCVAYLTIASNTIPLSVEQFAPNLSEGSILLQKWFWLLLTWVLIAMPLSMLHSVKFLGYTSALAVLCVCYTLVIVIMYTANVLDPCDKPIPLGETCKGEVRAVGDNVGDIMMSIPVYFSAFSCSPSIFNIYNAMYKPTPKRLNVSTSSCVGICMAFYLLMSLCGYFIYGSNVAPNILNSFPVEAWATIARLGTAFVVIVSFPLLMHPARDGIVHAVNLLSCHKLEKWPRATFYTVALVLNCAAALIAFLNVDLDLILSITGSVGVINLSLTIPFAFYYKMYEDTPGWRRMICIPGIIFGLAMSIVCGYFSVAAVFTG